MSHVRDSTDFPRSHHNFIPHNVKREDMSAPLSKNAVSANIKHSRYIIKRQISSQSTAVVKG